MGTAHKITELDHTDTYFANKTRMSILSILWIKKKMIQLMSVCVCACVYMRTHVQMHVYSMGVPLYACVSPEYI